jgi:hypothetical protein
MWRYRLRILKPLLMHTRIEKLMEKMEVGESQVSHLED